MNRKVNGIVLSKTPNRLKGEVEDLQGNVYSRLTVVEFDSKNKHGRAKWECLCSCGTVRVVEAQHLKSGRIKSCNCLNRELSSKRMKKNATTHGASKEPWFSNYSSMVTRAHTEGSDAYIKYEKVLRNAPIKIDPSWVDDPYEFYKEIGDKPGEGYSIDRIDNDLGYVPGNVRWADKTTQAVNRRLYADDSVTGVVGVTVTKAGINRMTRDSYKPSITVQGKPLPMGRYRELSTAKVIRHRAEVLHGHPITATITEEDIAIHLKESIDICLPKLKEYVVHSVTGETLYFETKGALSKHFGRNKIVAPSNVNTGIPIKSGALKGWKVYSDK